MACRVAASRSSDPALVQKNDGPDPIREFARCATTMQALLSDDKPLNDEQFLFMNNYCQNLQMAYVRWQGRHKPGGECTPVE